MFAGGGGGGGGGLKLNVFFFQHIAKTEFSTHIFQLVLVQ